MIQNKFGKIATGSKRRFDKLRGQKPQIRVGWRNKIIKDRLDAKDKQEVRE